MEFDRSMTEAAFATDQRHDPLRPGQEKDQEAIRRTAEEFEAVFLAEMLRPMFESINTSGMFGGGSAERVSRSLMVEEYGKALSRNGGVGIAASVERELMKMQEIEP